MLRPDQVLVIYDGRCPFCSGVVHFLRRFDWRDKLVCLPYQTRGLPEAVGTTVQQTRRMAMTFAPSGHLWRAFGAVAAGLDALLPFGLPIVRAIYLVPGLHRILDRLYFVVSDNRNRIPLSRPDLEEGEHPPLDPNVEEELGRRRLASRMPSALPGPALTLH
ncbi:thiol-disulfide oxidoreductase DCC family protein [Vulgatibacter sp.]|uniref:thiol-disulfide oxidoreductase DCC family protein n=1 Tax=Vulgatibacter sp. TaxID=1971226 RepID=UPI00356791E3